jgi:sulfur-oxidizing protein SoxY
LWATPDEVSQELRDIFGQTPIQEGRVELSLPALAENGNSVALGVDVDSPMSDADHVVSVHIFAEKNPLPRVVEFELGPLAGKASIRTRIRLADSQRVLAVARMSDGSLFSGAATIEVTQAACLDFLI